jgi:hypothetical protein
LIEVGCKYNGIISNFPKYVSDIFSGNSMILFATALLG